MTIIGFSGMDCSGKSTQITKLEERLVGTGRSTIVHWYRPGYSPQLDRLRASVRQLRPGALPRSGQASASKREATFQRPGVRVAWVAMALADLWVQYALQLRRLESQYDVVLSDRTVLDARMDFDLRFPDLRWLWDRTLKLAQYSMPTMVAHFLLTADYDELVRRQALKKEPFPDSPAVRDARFRLYSAIGDGVDHLDPKGSLDDVHQQIWATLVARGALP